MTSILSEEDYKHLRLVKALLIYRRKYDPEPPEPTASVRWSIFLNRDNRWEVMREEFSDYPGTVYFSEHTAQDLADKLNDGRITIDNLFDF